MPRKGKANRESTDRATALPVVDSSKGGARTRDLSASKPPPTDRGFAVGGTGAGVSLDPLAAVLADGSDVPSQRVLHPTREQIELRAYEIYLRRAGAPGNPDEDWYQAERELAEEMRASDSQRPGATGRQAATRGTRKSSAASAVAAVDDLRAGEAAG